MQALITVLHVLVSIAIIILVLLQHGKGADVGATFGSGGSQTMFGSAGSMSFFMKITGLLALIFFATSLTLSYMGSHQSAQPAFFQNWNQPQKSVKPIQNNPIPPSKENKT